EVDAPWRLATGGRRQVRQCRLRGLFHSLLPGARLWVSTPASSSPSRQPSSAGATPWHSLDSMADLDSPDDQRLFDELVRGYCAGEFSRPARSEPFEPLQPGDILPLPSPGTPDYA